MKEQITIGVIGCGSVAQNAYLPLAINLVAKGKISEIHICDQNQTRIDEVKKSYKIASATTNVDEILSREEIDLIVILTSMKAHAELCIRALKTGKNVLVEKPMATNLEQAKEIIELAKSLNKKLVCAPHVQLSPDYQEMYRHIESGALGKTLLARARYGWDGPDWSEWFYEPGGGPLFDLGVYNVTSLTGLLGPARRVSCLSTLTRPERQVNGKNIKVETDDTFQIVIEHQSGAMSTVTTAFGMQRYRGPAVEVYGLNGTIQMMGDDWAPTGLEYWNNNVGAWQLIEGRSLYWPWTDGLSHIVDCIIKDEKPYTIPEQAYHVLEIMLAAMESAKTGTVQDISSTFEPPKAMSANRRKDAHRIHDKTHEDAQ